MKIATSPITNTIYAGNTRKPKNGPEVWTKKEDVTDQVISAMFEWLKEECRKGGTDFFEVKYPSRTGRIVFAMKDSDVD